MGFEFNSIGFYEDIYGGKYSGGKFFVYTLPFAQVKEGITRKDFVETSAPSVAELQSDFWRNPPLWIACGDSYKEAEINLYEKYLPLSEPKQVEKDFNFIEKVATCLSEGKLYSDDNFPNKSDINEAKRKTSVLFEVMHFYGMKDKDVFDKFMDIYNDLASFSKIKKMDKKLGIKEAKKLKNKITELKEKSVLVINESDEPTIKI